MYSAELGGIIARGLTRIHWGLYMYTPCQSTFSHSIFSPTTKWMDFSRLQALCQESYEEKEGKSQIDNTCIVAYFFSQ